MNTDTYHFNMGDFQWIAVSDGISLYMYAACPSAACRAFFH